MAIEAQSTVRWATWLGDVVSGSNTICGSNGESGHSIAKTLLTRVGIVGQVVNARPEGDLMSGWVGASLRARLRNKV